MAALMEEGQISEALERAPAFVRVAKRQRDVQRYSSTHLSGHISQVALNRVSFDIEAAQHTACTAHHTLLDVLLPWLKEALRAHHRQQKDPQIVSSSIGGLTHREKVFLNPDRLSPEQPPLHVLPESLSDSPSRSSSPPPRLTGRHSAASVRLDRAEPRGWGLDSVPRRLRIKSAPARRPSAKEKPGWNSNTAVLSSPESSTRRSERSVDKSSQGIARSGVSRSVNTTAQGRPKSAMAQLQKRHSVAVLARIEERPRSAVAPSPACTPPERPQCAMPRSSSAFVARHKGTSTAARERASSCTSEGVPVAVVDLRRDSAESSGRTWQSRDTRFEHSTIQLNLSADESQKGKAGRHFTADLRGNNQLLHCTIADVQRPSRKVFKFQGSPCSTSGPPPRSLDSAFMYSPASLQHRTELLPTKSQAATSHRQRHSGSRVAPWGNNTAAADVPSGGSQGRATSAAASRTLAAVQDPYAGEACSQSYLQLLGTLDRPKSAHLV